MRVTLVSIAGVAGVLLRYLASLATAEWASAGLPWGTFFVNVSGSLAIGVVAALGFEHGTMSESTRIALMTGLLGGFTTFSSFSLETVKMAESGQFFTAMAYVLVSLVSCLGATAIGMYLVR